MSKGTGSNPKGVRWLVQTRSPAGKIWATREFYTEAEIMNWWFARPIQPLYPLDISL